MELKLHAFETFCLDGDESSPSHYGIVVLFKNTFQADNSG